MYRYYRAMSLSEANTLDKSDEIVTVQSKTYWTDGQEPAELYKTNTRVIVRITVDKPIPSQYKGIAHGVSSTGQINNHNEWVVPVETFNDYLGYNLTNVEIL